MLLNKVADRTLLYSHLESNTPSLSEVADKKAYERKITVCLSHTQEMKLPRRFGPHVLKIALATQSKHGNTWKRTHGENPSSGF